MNSNKKETIQITVLPKFKEDFNNEANEKGFKTISAYGEYCLTNRNNNTNQNPNPSITQIILLTATVTLVLSALMILIITWIGVI